MTSMVQFCQPKRRILWLVMVVALQLLVPTEQTQSQETHEFWPELQFHYRFDDRRSQAIFMASHNRNRDSGSVYQAQEGLTFEHRFTDTIRGGIGYRHGNSTDGGPFIENRLLMEQS
jgi:hypothetical protein